MKSSHCMAARAFRKSGLSILSIRPLRFTASRILRATRRPKFCARASGPVRWPSQTCRWTSLNCSSWRSEGSLPFHRESVRLWRHGRDVSKDGVLESHFFLLRDFTSKLRPTIRKERQVPQELPLSFHFLFLRKLRSFGSIVLTTTAKSSWFSVLSVI